MGCNRQVAIGCLLLSLVVFALPCDGLWGGLPGLSPKCKVGDRGSKTIPRPLAKSRQVVAGLETAAPYRPRPRGHGVGMWRSPQGLSNSGRIARGNFRFRNKIPAVISRPMLC
ncbi:MAG: hypothetical protein KatS3mg110_4460 [Pirellulaceae bacterium]|nr:MAG: hypothetical protein KatS3mg110_4460 [Pirellulaceae bacterium]